MDIKRYFLIFLAGHAAASALCLGMVGIAFANWFMSSEPLWFGVLTVLVSLLPYAAAGELAGRRSVGLPHPHRGLPILLGVMTLVWLVTVLAGEKVLFSLMIWNLPCYIAAGMAAELLDLTYRWGYQTYLHMVEPICRLINFCLPVLLYHLGWTIRRWEE